MRKAPLKTKFCFSVFPPLGIRVAAPSPACLARETGRIRPDFLGVPHLARGKQRRCRFLTMTVRKRLVENTRVW